MLLQYGVPVAWRLGPKWHGRRSFVLVCARIIATPAPLASFNQWLGFAQGMNAKFDHEMDMLCRLLVSKHATEQTNCDHLL